MKVARTILALVVAFGWASTAAATGLTIGSWDDAAQRGGDLATPDPNRLGYSSFAGALSSRGHTTLAGTPQLTSSYLGQVDVFFWGVSSHLLSASEANVLRDFVAGGGGLLVEVNSAWSEQHRGNLAMNALGLGSPWSGNTGGSQSPTAGTFTSATTQTTVGNAGDVRGQSFGSSMVARTNPTGGTLVGWNGLYDSWAEFQPYAAGATILCVGDPYGFNIFQKSGDSHYNPNNQIAYLNYIESIRRALSLPLDIKPASWPNPLNPKSRGVLPVAICGSENFDVMSIDPDSILFGDGAVLPLRWSYEDVATPFGHDDGGGHELGGDGFTDLALKFSTRELVDALGLRASAGGTIPVALSGALIDGTPFEATDYLWVLNPGDMDLDGAVTVDDIHLFTQAVVDGDGYLATYGVNANLTGDLDGDGMLTTGDISGLVELLVSGGAGSVIPEPATLSLLVIGGLVPMLSGLKRRRKS